MIIKNKLRSYIPYIITIRRIMNIKYNIVSYYIEDVENKFFWIFFILNGIIDLLINETDYYWAVIIYPIINNLVYITS